MAELVESVASQHDQAALTQRHDHVLRDERVVVVTNIPAPYRIPLFNGVARRLRDAHAEFRVIFLAGSPNDRSWMQTDLDRQFSYDVLQSIEMPIGVRRSLLPFSLGPKLKAFRPTLVLSGGFSVGVCARGSLCGAPRNPVWHLEWRNRWLDYSGGPHTHDAASVVIRAAKLCRRVRLRGGRILEERSDPTCRSFTGGTRRTRLPAAQHADARTRLSSCLRIGDVTSPNKGIDVIIGARRHEPRLKCKVRIVGGGALLPGLMRKAADDDRIEFLGPLPQATVAQCLHEADVFVFPSREDRFGLALVEAMHAGLAVISSTNPGAVGDLAVHGHNAWLVDGHAPRDWANAMAQVTRDTDLRLALERQHGIRSAAAGRSVTQRTQ